MLSKVHAALALAPGGDGGGSGLVLMDLGSRNGTWLERAGTGLGKLRPKEATGLLAGDVVVFGSRPSKSRKQRGSEARYQVVRL